VSTKPSNTGATTLSTARKALRVALPAGADQYEQDEEWFLVKQPEGWRQVRLHNYDEIFSIPGLYEKVVYEIMGCQSPQTLRKLLDAQLGRIDLEPDQLSVLDLGAGNGYVAQELSELGVETFVGVDIEPMAKVAAERDRPGLYDDYVAADITDLPADEVAKLEQRRFNCLTCVAALGFGDIPPEAFVEAFNRIEDGGIVAITIKKDFVDEDTEPSGFALLLRELMDSGAISRLAERPFLHRYNVGGDAIEYVALIFRKHADAPN